MKIKENGSFYNKRITYHWHISLFFFFDFSVIFIIQITFALSWYNLSPQERQILKTINYDNQQSILKQKNYIIVGESKAMALNHDRSKYYQELFLKCYNNIQKWIRRSAIMQQHLTKISLKKRKP